MEPREYGINLQGSGNRNFINRLLCATPTTGVIRMEWAAARFGQIIPCNWSYIIMNQFMNGYVPYQYAVVDAQNMIANACVAGDYEWLLIIEQDTCPPADAFIRFNQYMLDCKVPVVSGLYYTKSRPSEPIVYRGRGNSYYDNFKIGDKVWADGVPMGCILIHGSIMKELWKESPEYQCYGTIVRRVFEAPAQEWFDPQESQVRTLTGTTDLNWCSRVINDKIFKKAGWPEYQKKKYPFLVDTNIFCKHIDINGETYP